MMVDFLRVGFLFAVVLISPCHPKCLMYLDDAREILGSKIPPITDSLIPDNYYNISRALYPSVRVSALYVKVTIHFLKDNGTMIDDQTKALMFTWSKACSYVCVKHLSLYAMSVFSLATIFPQRRQSELVISVPSFCRNSPYARNNDTKRETWRYIVSTLEDVLINPKVSDPRVNTVGCVVSGHEGDITEYPKLWYFGWFILGSSLSASFSLWIFLLQSIHDNMKETQGNIRKVYGAALRTVVLVTVISYILTVVLVPLLSHLKSNADLEMYLYFIVYAVISVILFIIGCVCTSCCNIKKCVNMYQVGVCFLFPCLFQTFHHFFWVVCGIISEPFWAIPIFLLECLFIASIQFALFLYECEFCNDATGSHEYASGKYDDWMIKGHLLTCWVSFALVLVTVALIAINNGKAVASPTAGAIESVLTVIFIWLLRKSRLDFWSRENKRNKPATNGNSQELQTLTTNT